MGGPIDRNYCPIDWTCTGYMGKSPKTTMKLFPFETWFPTLSSICVLTKMHKFGAINRVLLSTLETTILINLNQRYLRQRNIL